LVVLSRQQALARFVTHSPGLIPGIGPKTVSKLESMGITTLIELGAHSADALEEAFGPRQGRWLYRRGRLEDETPVTTVRETKSQSAETTFDVDVADHGELEAHLQQLSAELCRRLRKRDLRGRSVGIKVRLDDWTNVTRSHTLEQPTDDPAVVAPVALDLLRAYDPPRPVRLLGVRVASFEGGEDVAGDESEKRDQMRLGLTA
jgi:DNA polymerase-4